MHPSRRGRRLGGLSGGWVYLSVPHGVHLLGRGGPPAGLPCGSQIPTYSSFSVRPFSARGGTSFTMCRPVVRVRGHAGGGWGGVSFWSRPISVGGGGRGSKKSAPQFPGPQGEPAHGLHPRFVVAEIWADGRGGGGGAHIQIVEGGYSSAQRRIAPVLSPVRVSTPHHPHARLKHWFRRPLAPSLPLTRPPCPCLASGVEGGGGGGEGRGFSSTAHFLMVGHRQTLRNLRCHRQDRRASCRRGRLAHTHKGCRQEGGCITTASAQGPEQLCVGSRHKGAEGSRSRAP